MAIISTKNTKVLSNVLLDTLGARVHDYSVTHRQTATEASDTVYELGQVVVWDTDHWEILKTTVPLTSESTTDTAGQPLAVVVGFEDMGDMAQATVTSEGRNVAVLYQGPVNVKEVGLVFDEGLTDTEVNAAKIQLTKQGIKFKDVAAPITTSFYYA